MKNKFDILDLVKVAGWIAVAIGGIATSWASDKQMQKQNEENFKNYIKENSKES